MIKNSIVIFALFVLFFSCKKDPSISIPVITNNLATSGHDTMLPLAVGNYWIYQRSQDDSIGTYTMQNGFDSLYIEKDSIILGNQYFKFRHTNHYFLNYFMGASSFEEIWIKDSLGFLITYPRGVALNPVNLRDTVFRSSDTTSTAWHFCIVPDTFVNRDFIIGQLSGLWMKGYSFVEPPFSFRSGQHYFSAYAKNIGLIRMRNTFSACTYLCRFSQHLIRYHLN